MTVNLIQTLGHLRHPHVEELTLAKHFKGLGGEQSLPELLVSFWLIPFSVEFLACKLLFADLISWDPTQALLKPNCLVPHPSTSLQPYHHTKSIAFLLLYQIQLTDMTGSVISWMQVGF